MIFPRADDTPPGGYINPIKELNAGLWSLFAGATVFLGLRFWCKYIRRYGVWYDDHVLLVAWLVLMITDILISCEYATGYVTGNWDDRMHILINVSSCGTLIGQSLSKSALGITLLRLSNRKQKTILWFCLISMNLFALLKVFFTWAKLCGKSDYQNWYRFQSHCIDYTAEGRIKVGGNTYNIIMDFVFALFPWWITWSLEMRRIEKLALCITMSLGMIIAILSAVRTVSWEYRPIMHVHDAYYMWRNAMSNIWYSAEVAGTIIVQCVPVLRPLIKELHTTLTSKKLGDTENGRSVTWRSTVDGKRGSVFINGDRDKKGPEAIALGVIPEEPRLTAKKSYLSTSSPETLHQSTPTTPAGPLSRESWPFSESERTDIHSPHSETWAEAEQPLRQGLWPPPPRSKRL